MSDDWHGWYQNKPGSGYQPTEAYQGGAAGGDGGAGRAAADRTGAWPSQPPTRSAPGGGEPERWDLGGGGGHRWRFWGQPGRRGRRIALIIGTVVAVLTASVTGTYFWLDGKLNRDVTLPATSLTSAGTNWLITGSDSRAGLNRKEENQLSLGHDISGSRSDTIMLLHVPANGTRPTLVSLPRDSYVPIPGHGYNKLNAAYAFGGPKLLVQTVQNATGLPIDHYMGIGFGGLVSVVNDVGGVDICLKAPMKDPKAGLNLKAGCQTLNGDQALGFVRTRAFAEGDLQREQDQRILIKGILSKMTSAGTLANPFAIVPAANGAASAITTDQGTGLTQLISVAFALKNPVTTTVPVANLGLSTSVGSVVVWNHTAARQFFSDLSHDRPLPKNLVTGSSVQGTA